jgi:hypothetical protein
MLKQSAPSTTSVGLGWCRRSEARAGEVVLLLSAKQPARKRTSLFRLLANFSTRLGFHRRLHAKVWAQTLLLEMRSLYFRIRDMRERDLVDRYEMGPACASCQQRGTQYRCMATRAYIRNMQQLNTRLPWLSYSDSTLVREGWNLAFQSKLDSRDCGMERDLEDGPSLTHLSGGNSMPSPAVPQTLKA